MPAAQQPAKPQAQANGTGELARMSNSTKAELDFFFLFFFFALLDQTLLLKKLTMNDHSNNFSLCTWFCIYFL